MDYKKKAKELVDKFEMQFNYMVSFGDTRGGAKDCALVCVEELIKEEAGCKCYNFTSEWNKVKEEIKKL